MGSIASSPVDASLEYPEGEWEHIFVYTHVILTFEDIHFDLQVAIDSEFADIVVDVSTSDDITGWQYESEPYRFVQLPDSGFPANFSGRRIKYLSPETQRLRRSEIYYIRWRALNVENVRVFPINQEYFVETSPLIVAR